MPWHDYFDIEAEKKKQGNEQSTQHNTCTHNVDATTAHSLVRCQALPVHMNTLQDRVLRLARKSTDFLRVIIPYRTRGDLCSPR